MKIKDLYRYQKMTEGCDEGSDRKSIRDEEADNYAGTRNKS